MMVVEFKNVRSTFGVYDMIKNNFGNSQTQK